ncbi:hypothetical protein BDW66DRAFT_57761 [Aspergillus desertorum]
MLTSYPSQRSMYTRRTSSRPSCSGSPPVPSLPAILQPPTTGSPRLSSALVQLAEGTTALSPRAAGERTRSSPG